MTANAVTSVSLEPLLVLVCVEREARFHDAIVESGVWGVSILAASAARRRTGWPRVVGRCTASWTVSPTTRGRRPAWPCSTARSRPWSAAPPTSTPPATTASSSGRWCPSPRPSHPADALLYYRGRYETLA